MQNRISCALVLLLFSGACLAGDAKPARPEIDDNDFTLRLAPRTPNQIAAFYEARGFPRFAIDEVKKACFITVGLRNKSNTIVWFNLGNWRFSTTKGPLKRIRREDWKQRWNDLGLEQRFQSTFRWTLSPEQLDFRPNEREGGNITLPRTDLPITITGEIYVGKQKNRLYQVKFENISCARD
jgi:hypothetical protein